MNLSIKTLEKLRILINEETTYRSGLELVKFFNILGFNDVYLMKGFPSRWQYTDEKLTEINGTPKLDICIKNIFNPINFIDNLNKLDAHITDFNKYLLFDKWNIKRNNTDIIFQKLEKIELNKEVASSENNFLNREFNNININQLQLNNSITILLENRINEINKCFNSKAYLAVILLAGSTLEGIMLGLATSFPKKFNMASSSPKDKNGVKQFQYWTLNNFIDVAKDLEIIQKDTYKFSHSLRDFRNYIHPFEQLSSGFNPHESTAKICLQVLKAVIYEISKNFNKL